MQYRVKDDITLEGNPAGIGMGNYVDLHPGDIVVLASEICDDNVVLVNIVGSRVKQWVDFTSLEEL